MKEEKQSTARDKYARDYAGSGKPTIPAPATPTPKAGQEAAPVLKTKEKAMPKPKPKADAAHHLSRSSMPKVKGKGEELREAKVAQHHLAQRTRRRYHAISTSSSSHLNMARIVHSVMIRRSLTTIQERWWQRQGQE